MFTGKMEKYGLDILRNPDYMTQGESLEELKDILKELTSGNIPCVRKVAELEVA